MSHVITLIPGDGIGPEVSEAVVRIFKVAGLDVQWDRHDAGVMAFKRFNQSLPVELLESIRKNKVALKGPVTTPIGEGFTSVNVGLRKRSISTPTCGRSIISTASRADSRASTS